MKTATKSLGLRARRKPALGAKRALPASGEKNDCFVLTHKAIGVSQ